MEKRHDVHFYRQDFTLVGHVVAFLAAAIRRVEPIVVIATPFHRRAFAAGLRTVGLEIDDLIEGRDRYWLDAQDTLEAFMEGDRPSPDLFDATIGNVFSRVTEKRPNATIHAYGEMVDLLWRKGNAAGALELERLWNGLLERHSFNLLCAYADESLAVPAHGVSLGDICRLHQHATVVDPEVLDRFPSADRPAVLVSHR
jgi:hypothetical protein